MQRTSFFYTLLVLFIFCGNGFSQSKSSLSLKQIYHRQVDGFPNTPRLIKVGASGGSIDFDVEYSASRSLCAETYRFQWKFDQDMSNLSYETSPTFYGFELQTKVLNGDCGEIKPWRNPFVVAVANDQSSSSLLNEQGYDMMGFAKGISGGSGERLFFRDDNWVRLQQARQGFIRNRFYTKRDINSYGRYTWFKFTIVGNSNDGNQNHSFQYEIVYVYEIQDAPEYLNYKTLTLGTPRVNPNASGENGEPAIAVQIPGELARSSGQQFRLQVRFEDSAERPLKGNPGDPYYVDNRGNALSVSPLYFIPPDPYLLDQIQVFMPYRSLASTRRGQTIFLYGELWIDGNVVARSPKVPLQLSRGGN